MDIKEIFDKGKAAETIELLKKGRISEVPEVDLALKALDQEQHDVNNPAIRKDKWVKTDKPTAAGTNKVLDMGDDDTVLKPEKVARIRLALQKLIIKRAASFLFGNDVIYDSSPESDDEKAVVKAFDKVIKDTKSNTLNRRIARNVFAFRECAEVWHAIDTGESSERYGFETKFKLRCTILSPARGDTLYPYFDEYGDMVAFSRSFARGKDKADRTDFFETYTSESHFLWSKKGNEEWLMVDGYPKAVVIGKIPVVYAEQDSFETADVNSLIDRLEHLLSNFADTNDYHASPKIVAKGNIKGWAKKGESGAVIEMDKDGSVDYLSWANAPESVKLEIETILRMIYTISQTPDISFESVKGIGALSGLALKLLFMDAHLKVQSKREVFDEYLQRRANVIKAFIGKFKETLKPACDSLDFTPEITPYTLTNEIDELNYWLTANGNEPVISQEESIKKVGLTANSKDTYEKIKAEESRKSSFAIGEPIV